ncbi:hypothetical protein BO71DRAFT_403224 [Aspergillus ellipticus CBS 707.79]|uniref:Uncharacterized protein n=1 Tax=Aspergillus ellipticus CBS 707.79 TaxID=1448320 RepID=A0A319CXE9_9EURO|nr:hypothetical protein BO71DRAFT_403224 [Aspergillus ellipticus CBS 707.79]
MATHREPAPSGSSWLLLRMIVIILKTLYTAAITTPSRTSPAPRFVSLLTLDNTNRVGRQLAPRPRIRRGRTPASPLWAVRH